MKKSLELIVTFCETRKDLWKLELDIQSEFVRIEVMATNERFFGKEEHPGLSPNMKFISFLDSKIAFYLYLEIYPYSKQILVIQLYLNNL